MQDMESSFLSDSSRQQRPDGGLKMDGKHVLLAS